ncbi:MAG: ribosomal protein S18-alanine N-acetyltransferase [Deltaproteobacteria bacterium]|nr:ribosomal protein S18-alanine N-acetyltransferase [Deltaproteobacteria bacterium]
MSDVDQMLLADASPADLGDILCLEKACFRDPWAASSFLAEMEHPWSFFRVLGPARVQGSELTKILAFHIAWFLDGEMHILNLAVKPALRGQGLGRVLLKDGLEAFASRGGGTVHLEVRRSNLAAQGLYHGFGFKAVAIREGYYRREKEDAIIMMLPVASSAAEEFEAKVIVRTGS